MYKKGFNKELCELKADFGGFMIWLNLAECWE